MLGPEGTPLDTGQMATSVARLSSEKPLGFNPGECHRIKPAASPVVFNAGLGGFFVLALAELCSKLLISSAVYDTMAL